MKFKQNNISKNKNYITKSVVAFLLYLLMFFVIFNQVFIGNVTKLSQAGQPSDELNYSESPVYIAGTNHIETDALNAPALFTKNGINANVLLDLLNMVNSDSVWNENEILNDNYTYLSAYDFGKYYDSKRIDDPKLGYSQISVKLFDDVTLNNITTTIDNQTIDIQNFTNQLWQVVYRSMDNDNDVLTLYMSQPYTSAYFNYEKNNQVYDESNLQEVVTKTWQELLNSFDSITLSDYVVTPNDLLGQWQFNQPNDISYSNHNELSVDEIGLWIPSGYECLETSWDESECISVIEPSSEVNPPKYTSMGYDSQDGWQGDGRTGLWKLNAYDRAWGDDSISAIWLRSGYYQWGDCVRGINNCSWPIVYNAKSELGVRPAIHINLKKLCEEVFAKISISQNGLNDYQSQIFSYDKNWSNKVPSFYMQFNDAIVKQSSQDEGIVKLVYLFENELYLNSFVIKCKSGEETISLVNKSPNKIYHSQYCDYSFTSSNGEVVLNLGNVADDLNVIFNFTEKILTKLNVTFNSLSQIDCCIIVNVYKGDQNNYSSVQQISVGKQKNDSQTVIKSINLLLEMNEIYTIVISKPYTFLIEFDENGLTKNNCYEFVVQGEYTHTINILGSFIPNINVSI